MTITEDNCVLEDFELWMIEFALGFFSSNENIRDDLIRIKSKITKLNDLVKQARKEIDLNQVDSVFQTTGDQDNE